MTHYTIANSPRYAERIEAIRNDWGLPEGEVFINRTWSNAKNDILEAVSAEDLPSADDALPLLVDPDEASADLFTSIDSGSGKDWVIPKFMACVVYRLN